jgi:hypothetical protein
VSRYGADAGGGLRGSEVAKGDSIPQPFSELLHLGLMGTYRLVVEEVEEARAITSYTRWVEAVLVNESEDQVYVTLSPRFERLWLEVKKRLVEHAIPPAIHTGVHKVDPRLQVIDIDENLIFWKVGCEPVIQTSSRRRAVIATVIE